MPVRCQHSLCQKPVYCFSSKRYNIIPRAGVLPNRPSEKESSKGQSGELSTLPASSLCTACKALTVSRQQFLKVCFQQCTFRFGRWKMVTFWVKSKSSSPQQNVLVTLFLIQPALSNTNCSLVFLLRKKPLHGTHRTPHCSIIGNTFVVLVGQFFPLPAFICCG